MSQLASAVAEVDAFALLRRKVDEIAAERGEWGGAPMIVEGLTLRMEPRYPFQFNKLAEARRERVGTEKDYELLNEWYCYHKGRTVYVYRDSDGKSRCYTLPERPGKRLTFLLNTLAVAASGAWDATLEARAVEKLKSLVRPHTFEHYQLTGVFLETSKRSGVTYLFRKLRPTIAMKGKDGEMKVLSILCLHPLGYYEETWAGVMTPTDDVIAHLLLMRGDEHHFWKKANHHEMWMPSAGI